MQGLLHREGEGRNGSVTLCYDAPAGTLRSLPRSRTVGFSELITEVLLTPF
jgi:hypothetical protein